MIYVIFTAPWGEGHRPFEETTKGQKQMFTFLKDLKKYHTDGSWGMRSKTQHSKLSVTFKQTDLWNQ